jgi:nitrate reductase molybdenum cofactor assembly chaperone NarJ/NarW
MVDQNIWKLLASALEYPTEGAAGSARAAAAELRAGNGEVAAGLDRIAAAVEEGVHSAEERYTRLFDLKPVCTLNIAWHIFGDTYARGALMAQLVPELERHGVEFRHDLPDYLPSLLRLLSAFEDEEDRQLLAHAVILPGLKKVARTLEGSSDPWALVLAGLPEVIARLVPKLGRTDIPVPRRALEVLNPC